MALLQQTPKVFKKKGGQTYGWRSTQKKEKNKKTEEEKSQSQQPLLGPRRPRPWKFVARRLRWGYKGQKAVTVHCRTLPTLRSSLVPSSSKMRANLLRCLEWVRRIRAINVKVPIFLIHFYHICASVICFNLVVTFFYFSLGLPKYNFLNSGAVVYENLVKSRHRKIRMFLQH